MSHPPLRSAATGLLALLVASAACHSGRSARAPVKPVGVIEIPRTREPMTIDGKSREPSWAYSYRSPSFEDAYGRRNPTAQFRALADDQNLYILIYVGDVDIESQGDVIRLDVGPVHVELTPKGATAPRGVRTAIDTDDTIDNPMDNDEEWINEVAIPWSLLGSYEVPVRAVRIDVGRNLPPHALAWPRSAPTLLKFDPHGGE